MKTYTHVPSSPILCAMRDTQTTLLFWLQFVKRMRFWTHIPFEVTAGHFPLTPCTVPKMHLWNRLHQQNIGNAVMEKRIKGKMRKLRIEGEDTLQVSNTALLHWDKARNGKKGIKNLWFARTNQKLFPIKSVRTLHRERAITKGVVLIEREVKGWEKGEEQKHNLLTNSMDG